MPFFDTQESFNISYRGSIRKLFSYVVGITKIRVDPNTPACQAGALPFELVLLLYRVEAFLEAVCCTERNHL